MLLSKQYIESFKNIEFGSCHRNNESSTINGICLNKITISFISTICQLFIIDIIFIIFNIYINKYILSSINHIFILAINFAMAYTSLIILRRLDIYSSELVLNLERKVNLNVIDRSSNHKLLNLGIQCLNSFHLIKNGIISSVCLLLYPIRFGIFGYIFFNSNWKIFSFVNKVVELLIFTAIFEFLKIQLLIIPEQKSILIKISDYFDNLKTLLLLSNHRENYINSSKATISFARNLLNYIISLFQSICIIYFVFKILHYFNENLHEFESSQIYIFNYWFAIYLIYSVRYINSCIFLVINYKYVSAFFCTAKKLELNYNHQSKNLSYLNNVNSELSCKTTVLEPLINIRAHSNAFKAQKDLSVPYEKCSLMYDIHDNHVKEYCTNYSNSEIISGTTLNESDGYNSDDKNNTVLNYGNYESNVQSSNNVLFNPVIISYKNLSLSFSCKDEHEKQIQNFSNRFKYLFDLYWKKINILTNCCSNYHKNEHLDTFTNNELIENKFHLNNINLYIKMNETIFVFGSNYRDKELLTKYISGFPGIRNNEKFEYRSNLFKCDVHLINRSMLEFVSNFCEFQKSEFTMDPLEFILSGNSFNKTTFELIYNSLLRDYFTENEFLRENNEINKNHIYPKIENIQQFVEAKIFLQLSQFFYNILISLDDHSSAIIIIDGIFELLLPATYIKLVEKILPNNSLFSRFNISFIITTENDLFPYLSYLYKDHPFVKLAIINEKELKFIDNNLNMEFEERFFDNLPSIDNTINEVFNVKLNNNFYFCSKNMCSINELYFRQFESENFYSSKFLLFVSFIGLISFIIKFITFYNQHFIKNPNQSNDVYDFFIFEILSFYPLFSLSGTSTYFNSNGLSSMFIGYITISSFFLNNYNVPLFSEIGSLKNQQATFKYERVYSFEKLTKFSRVEPEKNYRSSYFINLSGNQVLKTSSSFYRDHFFDLNVINIPGIKPTGLNNALVSSKLIQNVLNQKPKKKSNSRLLPKHTQFSMGQKLKLKFNKNIILTLTLFFLINIISKIFIYILIFGFSLININSMCNYNCLSEFLKIILCSDDPISVINDVELRKNRYFLYLFEEIYFKRSKITMQYFILIHFLSLLFFFAISNNIYSINGAEVLINKNLLIIIMLFPILYIIIKYFNLNREKIKFPIIKCNSFDYFYYLNKSNSFSWFENQISELFKIKLESSKKFFSFKLNILLSSLTLSITTSCLYFLFKYKKNGNNEQLIIDLVIFLPIMFFLIQYIHFYVIEESKANISHKLNFFDYLKPLKRSIYKAYYFPTYIKVSTNLTSPKTNTTFSPDNREKIRNEDGYELSTPISRSSQKTDSTLSINSLSIQLNSNITFSLINPFLFLDNSLTFGSGKSPLFPIKQLRTTNTNNFNRIAIVSNHNIIPSSWPINMVLDPKDIYVNDNKQLLHSLELLNIFPKILNNFDPKIILNLSIQEYFDLINFQINDNTFANGVKTFNIECDIGVSESSKLGEHKNDTNKGSIIDIICIKKLLLFGHFALYSTYYKELILHLDYDMDLDVWISLVRKFFDDKTSSINNIVIISSGVNLFKVDNVQAK